MLPKFLAARRRDGVAKRGLSPLLPGLSADQRALSSLDSGGKHLGEVHRRTFLVTSSRALLAGAVASACDLIPPFAMAQTSSFDGLEQRLAAAIEAYDAQGNHRTATTADSASAEWLVQQIQQIGLKPALEPFAVTRIDPLSCHLRVAGRRIEGVPLFDAPFTGAEGVRGTLGPLGSDADIALVETEPFTLVEPRRELAGALAQARRSGHKGIVILTRGSRPGLFLLNAPSFRTPFGPPALQVSSAEAEWLMAQAQRRAEVDLVVSVQTSAAQAFNVTTEVAGSDPALAPLVVTTPRSGWWQCASERGGGLACWLETMRALAAANPARDCLFAAFSGHEIGFLGIDAYLMPRSDLVRRARAWIHLGANIGAPRQPNLIQVSDASMKRWITASLEKKGLAVDHEAEAGSVPRGEAGSLHRGGARYAALVCGTEVFHNPADRWPDAIDVASLARYAGAFADGACELAR
jgi:hypothetical protein